MDAPSDEKIVVRQAYSFFYMTPDNKAHALDVSCQQAWSSRQLLEHHLGIRQPGSPEQDLRLS